jgi:nucleotide-binding universal stress UspA family protein
VYRKKWCASSKSSPDKKNQLREKCHVPKTKEHSIEAGTPARKKTLVPIDFTPASCSALRHGLSLVGKVPGRIVLLHVISGAKGLPGKRLEAQAEARLRDLILQEASATDHAIQTLIKTGTPFQEILAVAEELPAEMIVVGVNESGKLSPISLGHTAERVLRYASCPVLLVRPSRPAAAFSPTKSIR